MISIICDDLFNHVSDRTPVHCISCDKKMGLGIAVPMAAKYDLHNALKGEQVKITDVVLANGCLNMFTKQFYWHKPTMADFCKTLENLKEVCIRNGIKKLVMPKIGCGLDRLNWDLVLSKIKELFEQDFDVLICLKK